MKIQALREARNEAAKAIHNLVENNKTGWSADLTKQFEELEKKITDLDGQIDRTQKAMNLAAGDMVARHAVVETGTNPVALMERVLSNSAAPLTPVEREVVGTHLMNKWMRNGPNALDANEWRVVNTLSTTTGSEGGYTVQTEVAPRILEAMKDYGGMRRVATRLVSSTGATLSYPTSDGTAEMGEIANQNSTATATDAVFGTVTINVQKWSSKIIAVPIELLQDSQADIEGFVSNRMKMRIGRYQNDRYTNGSGSNEPGGMLTSLTTGRVCLTGSTVSVSYDDLVELQESIDVAYEEAAVGGLKWMMSQSARKMIRKLKDTNGRPIWLPSWDAGITGGRAEELLGKGIEINNAMPVPAASAKSIAYGDFSPYIIRDVLDVTLFRFADSVYASKGQVGFLCWTRSGGAWTDVGGAAKCLQHSAS